MRLKAKSRVAELRTKAGLTQAQLAVFVGVTPNTVQNWEKEAGLSQLEKYIKLCEILGCDLQDLIEYVPTDSPKDNQTKGFSLEELRELRQRWGTDTKSKVTDPQLQPKH
jgi:transcriptional regulator with XRE-family HTH domain